VTGAERPIEALRFPVEGMTCSSCVNRISRALGKVDGVRGVRVDLGRELVTVNREPGTAPEVAIADAIEATGYHARMHEATSVEVVPSPLQRLLRR
jgi:copper chaperone CopZ